MRSATITINSLAVSCVFLACSRAEEEPKLQDYSSEEVHAMIAEGDEELVRQHGDELLDLLYFRPSPTKEELLEAASNPPLLKPRKDELPTYKALRSQDTETLNLLRSTDHFSLPEHPMNLEIIAYLLQDILGQEAASSFAAEKLENGQPFEQRNWQQIEDMLDNPVLKSGRFLWMENMPKSSAHTSANSVRQERASIQAMIENAAAETRASSLETIAQFRQICQALNSYWMTHEALPNTILGLSSSGLIPEETLVFTDSDDFQIIPLLNGNLADTHGSVVVLRLDYADHGLSLVGRLDGTVRAKEQSN